MTIKNSQNEPECTSSQDTSEMKVPYGLNFQTYDLAVKSAKEISSKIGCDVFVTQHENGDFWYLELLADCAYQLFNKNLPDVSVDHMNHPFHYVGQPFHILGTGLDLDSAISKAKQAHLEPDQTIMISMKNQHWCVNASITKEQIAQVERIYAYFRDIEDDDESDQAFDAMTKDEVNRKLLDIESFREFLHFATDNM